MDSMKKLFLKGKPFIFPALLLLIPLLFFYKTVLFQQVPFPGDLLVSTYEPYKSQSNLGVVASKGQGTDVARQLYPWKYYSIELLKTGTFPLWNPYNFSGTPHFANVQSGTLYPVNILFFILPFVSAWSVFIVLQFIFAMVFMYLYLREIGLQKLSGLFGAVSFSFSQFFTVWAEYGNVGHSLSFFPLILFSIEKILRSPKPYWYLLLVISCSMSILAGYVQLTMYMYIVAVFYIAFRMYFSKKRNLKTLVLLIGSLIVGLLIAAVQLLPLYELLQMSLRSPYTYAQLPERLMPLENIIALLAPDYFGNPATLNYFLKGGSSLERASNVGMWTFIFAVFALCSKRNFYKVFFGITAVVFYISSLSLPPVVFFHGVGIPFLSTGVPTRALSIFCFSASVLAALGINSFLVEKHYKKPLVLISIIILLVIIVLWGITYVYPNPEFLISRRNLIIPSAVFLLGVFFLFSKIPKKITVIILLILTTGELFYSFQKFNSFVSPGLIYPQTTISAKIKQLPGELRYWGYGSAYINSNLQVLEKGYSPSGYDPLFSKRYGEFMAASKSGKIPLEVPRSTADIEGGYGVNDLKENAYRKRALDLDGVGYVLNVKNDTAVDSAFSEKQFTIDSQGDGWQIYSNMNVLPRVALFGDYKVVSDKNAIINTLYNQNFNFKKTVLLETDIPSRYKIKPDNKATAKIISYKPNEVVISTKSSQDQLLFLSDNYFPGWKATVDGVSTPLYRADYTFRAVPVKSGTHTVRMTYFPDSFKYGIYITVVSFLCLIITVVFVTMTKRGRRA